MGSGAGHSGSAWGTGALRKAGGIGTESAILGVSESEIVIAVFVNGLGASPEILRYSGKARDTNAAELKTEQLDYDPKEVIGFELDGFRRSKSCAGLNLSDGRTDSTHIYWNHNAHRFDDWTL